MQRVMIWKLTYFLDDVVFLCFVGTVCWWEEGYFELQYVFFHSPRSNYPTETLKICFSICTPDAPNGTGIFTLHDSLIFLNGKCRQIYQCHASYGWGSAWVFLDETKTARVSAENITFSAWLIVFSQFQTLPPTCLANKNSPSRIQLNLS